ncbi:hypothetical protein C2G38_2047876 [Gigaspora rosea]|uniref:Uncharacterized protein n=1 Tax=Gigaspora rosea TaxID=44941 RepID=A0A397U496_9GLOM|nr:hypothetical protein C2G38_2047876 [Gigaspora rosea]
MNSALRTQKRNKNNQDTSSSASKKTSKYNGKNEKQQNNNVASSVIYLQKQLSESTSIKNINQRREDYDDATSTNYKNTNITSQVSLSDNESDNSSVVSSPIYENNETTSPQSVSFAHENNEATSSHPVSSVYETDVSLPQEMISLYQLIEVPAQFQQVDNEFEIALWLARHKRILDLATNIRNGMMTRLDEGDEEHVTTSVSSILYEPILKLPEIDQEECKALFLQTRNNCIVLYEEIIVRVCKITKADPRLESLVRDVSGWFNTYRYKFHVAVVKLTNEFRALNESAGEPYDELNEFVTNDVWKQLLQMYLKATDQTKLKKDSEIFTQLKNFVHQVIKAVLVAQDNHKDTQNAIRKCDKYTIDLEIPTKFGIVKSLTVFYNCECTLFFNDKDPCIINT